MWHQDSDAVEEILALWCAADPDPVDVFEDRLASELGLHRHPSMTTEEWRRVRVAVIDGSEE